MQAALLPGALKSPRLFAPGVKLMFAGSQIFASAVFGCHVPSKLPFDCTTFARAQVLLPLFRTKTLPESLSYLCASK